MKTTEPHRPHALGAQRPCQPPASNGTGNIFPTYLNASQLLPSDWTPDEFTRRNCDEALKESIQSTGGNQIAVLVQRRKLDPNTFEIVCGHRRVQACRELALQVFAQILEIPKSKQEVFFTQECENKNRRDYSGLEQALRFEKVLGSGVFQSQDELADFIGISQPWISKVLPLAKLPKEIVLAFDDCRALQPRHAKQLLPALAVERESLLSRAAEFAKLRSTTKIRTVKETVRYLLGEVKDAADEWRLLIPNAPEVGKWKVSAADETTLRIPRRLSEAQIAAIAEIVTNTAQTKVLVDNLVIK